MRLLKPCKLSAVLQADDVDDVDDDDDDVDNQYIAISGLQTLTAPVPWDAS
jgi:hypothetical protein